MAKLVSTTYGDALFELALEENKIDSVSEEVTFLKDVLKENDELLKIMNHPKVPKEEKVSLVQKIFTNQISDDLVGFLTVVVTKGRYNEIFEIFDYYEAKVREYKNIGVAKVTSAVELSAEKKQQIEERLLAITKYTSFQMDFHVDESIIGGLIIKIDDKVVDNSIKTKLETMSRQLSKIQLN